MLLREGVVIPKLADAELILREPHQDIHCKNVRWTNGIWGPCPSADVGEHESIFSQSGIICLGRAGDACVVGALERVGDTLYGARVYVKLGRRLAHAHAARQSCSDSLSQLVRDRRPAKSFTFTLG